jgi:gluconolactonase
LQMMHPGLCFLNMKKYLTLLLLLTAYQSATQEHLEAIDTAFWLAVPRNARIEKVAGGFQFTEGPLWDARAGCLLFSDIPANTVYRLWPGGRVDTFLHPSQKANGLAFDRKGRLYLCRHATRQIVRIDKKGRQRVVATDFEGKKLNSPNDLILKGRTVYFTDPPFGLLDAKKMHEKELLFSGVFQMRKGIISLIDSTLVRPNGIALSPDGRFLYVSNTRPPWRWKAYELDKRGRVKRQYIFYEGTGVTDSPDGLKVDAAGRLFCTGNHGVMIFEPSGRLLGVIKFPEKPSNLAFGDADGRTLYVTARTGIYKIKLASLNGGK